MDREFWKHKQLSELNELEWEALCDGCGQCCLIQLEDSETNKHYFTRIACKQLDIGKCRCSSYQNRFSEIKNCVRVTPELLKTADWLPHTCAYRLIHEGKDLAWWHPLISKNPNTVHDAGISISKWAISENELTQDKSLEDFLEPDLNKK